MKKQFSRTNYFMLLAAILFIFAWKYIPWIVDNGWPDTLVYYIASVVKIITVILLVRFTFTRLAFQNRIFMALWVLLYAIAIVLGIVKDDVLNQASGIFWIMAPSVIVTGIELYRRGYWRGEMDWPPQDIQGLPEGKTLLIIIVLLMFVPLFILLGVAFLS